MLDIQFIRDNPALVKEKSKQKQVDIDIEAFLQLDEKRRSLLKRIDELRAKRNQNAESIKNKKPTAAEISEGKSLKEQIANLENQLEPIERDILVIHKNIPNISLDIVPVGKTEAENQIIKTHGTPNTFSFVPKSDAQLGDEFGLIDKERAAKISGARFAYLKGDLVRLQFALLQFVMDVVSEEAIIAKLVEKNKLQISTKPFTPVLPPAVIKTNAYEASARLNADEQTYKLADDDLWLNASAEHSLCTMHMNEVIDESVLPIRYIGYATSFRREAGSYGKDTEGIFRMHQFDKLELEIFSNSATGLEEHQLLVAIQEYIMQQLELPYQLIQKCTADIGKPNAQGVDINTWMPAQGEYRETHTADYMTDYQARRLKTKVRKTDGSLEYVHTNDATGVAMGRTLKAILENYQEEDKIRIPSVLVKYMNGKEFIV